jgi:putative flippase GtrA
MTAALPRRSMRYAGVSGCCALANNALLIGLDFIGLRALCCVMISAAVMIPLAYTLHTQWTFDTAPGRASFIRYAAISLLNLPASALLILLLRDGMQLPMIVIAPTVTIVLFCLNFFSARWSIGQAQDRPLPTIYRGRS